MNRPLNEVLGQTTRHIIEAPELGCFIHTEVLKPLQNLRNAAKSEGIDLTVASGYREYFRQQQIWNAKVTGAVPILDDNGNELPFNELSPKEIVFKTLRFCALPGFSRHHWGTDFDVYDRCTIPADYKVELTEKEASNRFHYLHAWLDLKIASKASLNFIRPFNKDRGGVAQEKWHISYEPIANTYKEMINFDLFKTTIEKSTIELKKHVLESAEEIFNRFIK